MSDVTIPADVAATLVDKLRKYGGEENYRLAALLDQRPVSLRDEVDDLLVRYDVSESVTDAVLAVVRRHIEALPSHPDDRHVWQVVRRSAVLDLFDTPEVDRG